MNVDHLAAELRELALERARLQQECDRVDQAYQTKLLILAGHIAETKRAPTAVDTPTEIRDLRGKTGKAVRLMFTQPEKVWTCGELAEHDLGFSNPNSMNTALTGLVSRDILVKIDRIGFKISPRFKRAKGGDG